MGGFIPSPQQSAYFDWLEDGRGNALVEAVAGSGKSTTLLQGLRYMRGSVFLGAFNKAIADELSIKANELGMARPGLRISTMHSICFGTYRRSCHNPIKVSDHKVRDIIDQLTLDNPDLLPMLDYVGFITKLVGLGKQYLAGIAFPLGDIDEWRRLVNHFSLDSELPDNVDTDGAIRQAIRVFEVSRANCRLVIDFDDMIYAPIAFNSRFFRHDWVLIDECQDTNPARREAAKRMLGGRFVGVGDSRQSIFGFTGATADAMALIGQQFACTLLPLTVSYRCPKAVVAYAHKWVTHIEAHPDAPEGVLREVAYNSDSKAADGKPLPWFAQDPLRPDDAVLCRYTAPLVRTAFAMLRAGIGCRIEGRNIGNGLIALATRWKVQTLNALEARLERYQAREIEKARKAKSESREQAAIDLCDTLRIFIERCRAKQLVHQSPMDCLVAEIQALFADDVSGVTTLSTIHRFKGRERPRIFWLQAEIKGMPRMQAWEKLQEANLNYVATSRAMQELVLVPEVVHTDIKQGNKP